MLGEDNEMRARNALPLGPLLLPLLTPAATAAMSLRRPDPPARGGSRWTAAGGLVRHGGWRVAIDVGREDGTAMPAGWAGSGCRLPLVVGCDFEEAEAGSTARVVPKSDEGRFTGPGGEVTGRIVGGTWTTGPSGGGDGTALSFTLSFPEELVRRDVTLGGTIRCEGLLYSTGDLRDLDAEYYAARDAKWEAGRAADEARGRADAPRRWNPDRERWERRDEGEGLPSVLWKGAAYLLAERRDRAVVRRRPMPKELSMDCGPFPGIEGDVYARRGGRVVLEGGWRERVVGTWSMEPITDLPVSYRGN